MNYLNRLLVWILLLSGSYFLQAQTSHSNTQDIMTFAEATSVEQVLLRYILAGDERDKEALDATMHENYRVLLNDPKKGSVSTFDKATYMGLVEKGVIGGIPRQVEILSLDIYQGVNAQVKTHLQSEKANFYNYYSLVKSADGWQVVQDMLTMVPIE